MRNALIISNIITVIVAVFFAVSYNSSTNDLQQQIEQLTNDNIQIQQDKDSIDQVRASYRDSLLQVRLDRLYFEDIIGQFDSILKLIPKKYEKDRNVIRNGDVDGTIGILSTF